MNSTYELNEFRSIPKLGKRQKNHADMGRKADLGALKNVLEMPGALQAAATGFAANRAREP